MTPSRCDFIALFMIRNRWLFFVATGAGLGLLSFLADPKKENSGNTVMATNPVRSKGAVVQSQTPNSATVTDFDLASLRASLMQAIAEAEGRTDPDRFETRAQIWQHLAASFPPRELGTVLRELSALQLAEPSESGRDLQLRILQRFAEYDLRAAAAEVAKMPAEDRPEAYERIAGRWARQNLAEAIAWTRQLSTAGERRGALSGIAAEVVDDHPAEVLALASEIPLLPEQHDLIARAASGWASREPESVVHWSAQIGDATLREEVLAAVAVTWADQDPNAAAQLVINSLSPGPRQENAVVGIMQRLALQDLDGARRWIAQFPAGPLRERAELELNRIVAKH